MFALEPIAEIGQPQALVRHKGSPQGLRTNLMTIFTQRNVVRSVIASYRVDMNRKIFAG